MDKTFSEEMLNLFRYPACIIIAGYTNSGKTHLCNKIIEKYQHGFNRIIICGVSSHALQQNSPFQDKVEVHEKIIDPVMDDDSPYSDPQTHTLLILDDNFLTAGNSQTIAEAFTKGRHKNLSVIMIAQNVFFPGKYARTITLNASHYILMKNRDIYQIECLGRQLYGRERAKHFVEIYKNVVLRRDHGYLLCDLSPNASEEIQLCTNIVDEPPCEKVYLL